MAVASKIQRLTSVFYNLGLKLLAEWGPARRRPPQSSDVTLPARTQGPPRMHAGTVPQIPCLCQFPQVPLVSMFTTHHTGVPLEPWQRNLLCT